jgi:AcrR family transcriptional regulator
MDSMKADSLARKKKGPIADRTKVPAERPGQPGGRRDTNRKERTKALSDAALALFLERGIEAVTIEDITTKAGVAKGSFYRYFDDKTGLTESLFAPVAAEVLHMFDFAPVAAEVLHMFDESINKIKTAKTKEEAFSSYEIIAECLGRILLSESDVVLLYLQENKAPAEGARAPARKLATLISEKAIEHTKYAREHGLLRSGIPPELSTLTVIGAAERLLFGVLAGENVGGEVWEIPGALITLILDGIRAPELK